MTNFYSLRGLSHFYDVLIKRMPFKSDQKNHEIKTIFFDDLSKRTCYTFKTTINIAFIKLLTAYGQCLLINNNNTANNQQHSKSAIHNFSANNYAVYNNDTTFYALFVAQIDFLVNLVSIFALYAVARRCTRCIRIYYIGACAPMR